MAEKKGMSKGVKIALIFATIGVLGVGGYFLFKVLKKKKEEAKDDKKADEQKSVDENVVKSSSYNKKTRSSKTYGATPFKNSTEGNKFRAWVNDNHKDYATKIDLDRSGGYDNAWIRKAWNEYGNDYETAMEKAGKSKGAVFTSTYGAKFQKVMRDWRKSHSLSTSQSTKGVPFFAIMFKNDTFLSKCIYAWNIYDRKKGEAVGGLNNQGYWKITKKNKAGVYTLIAWGRWDNDLRTIVVQGNNENPKSVGQTYSGGNKVGAKVSQVMGWGEYFSWC
jgi:hypothetical protein